MVAVGAPSLMPSRPFTATIIGGLWPETDPDHWSDVSEAMNLKARDLENDAATIRRQVSYLADENSGETIDAMCEMYLRDAVAVNDAATDYFTMSLVVSEIAQLIYHCRSRLDEIDRKANEEIQRIRDQATAETIPLAMQQITQAITQARADAMTESTAAAAEITRQASLIPTDAPATAMGSRTSGPGSQQSSSGDGGTHVTPAGHGTENAPRQPPGDTPHAPPAQPAPKAPGWQQHEEREGSRQTQESPRGGAGTGTSAAPGSRQREDGLDARPAMPLPPPMAMPPASASSGGAPGFSAPPLSSPLGGAGSVPPLNASSALNPAAGMMPPPASAVPPPSVGAADFSRGLNAGLAGSGGSAPPLLPPPVSSPPPPSAGPMGGAPSAAVPPVPAPPPAAANAGSPGYLPAGAAMVPPAAAGPLPPFGSDMTPRAVSPAAGPPAGPPAAAPPAGPGSPVAPLLPGVVTSGVGATAGAAGGALVSAPNPLLEAAVQLVYQLMHACRVYGCVDWCVGVFKTPHGADTVLCSNEGAGYIPPGVFVPRSARMLFADTGLGDDFRRRWFGWVNPAQTMLAYAALRGAHNPNVELHALAVSTDHGGSALPARDARVRHYEDCALVTSPIGAQTAPMPLDEAHMHRLQTVDPALYARLTQATLPESQQASEWWATTREAVTAALARASAPLGVAVPPVIRQVLATLDAGERVGEEQWSELALARFNASVDAASQRPGHPADDGEREASEYARAYHNLARAAEVQTMWRGEPSYPEIAYAAGQIMTEAQLWPDGAAS